LEFNHRPNLRRDERPDSVHERIRDRLDRLRLPGFAPALLETFDRFQAPMHLRGDHRLFNAPTEQPDNASGPFVDFIPTETAVDERLANGLEMERPKVPGREGPEQRPERPNREANVADFRCRLAVLPIVTVGEARVRQRQLIDREIAW
jgi:hypothetical protein